MHRRIAQIDRNDVNLDRPIVGKQVVLAVANAGRYKLGRDRIASDYRKRAPKRELLRQRCSSRTQRTTRKDDRAE